MIAAIRIRGLVNVNGKVEHTLSLLQLYRKNYCVLLEDKPEAKGMLNKAKDYIAWGEIDEETKKLLLEKRKEGSKKYFRLNPPRGGFGRKGIKVSFNNGGALGYMGKEINALLKRMV